MPRFLSGTFFVCLVLTVVEDLEEQIFFLSYKDNKETLAGLPQRIVTMSLCHGDSDSEHQSLLRLSLGNSMKVKDMRKAYTHYGNRHFAKLSVFLKALKTSHHSDMCILKKGDVNMAPY